MAKKNYSRVKEVAIQIGIIGFGVVLCALAKAEYPFQQARVSSVFTYRQDFSVADGVATDQLPVKLTENND